MRKQHESQSTRDENSSEVLQEAGQAQSRKPPKRPEFLSQACGFLVRVPKQLHRELMKVCCNDNGYSPRELDLGHFLHDNETGKSAFEFRIPNADGDLKTQVLEVFSLQDLNSCEDQGMHEKLAITERQTFNCFGESHSTHLKAVSKFDYEVLTIPKTYTLTPQQS